MDEFYEPASEFLRMAVRGEIRSPEVNSRSITCNCSSP